MKEKPTSKSKKSRSGPTIPEAERAARGQVRVRLSAEAVTALDGAALPGEDRTTAASRLVIAGAAKSLKTRGK